jgi:PKD repeat protein
VVSLEKNVIKMWLWMRKILPKTVFLFGNTVAHLHRQPFKIKDMKNKLIIMFALIAGCFSAIAQGNFYITGTVSGLNGPAGNVQVCVATDSTVQSNFSYYDCTVTDSNGYYSFGIPGGSIPGPNVVYTVSILACGTITSGQVQNNQGTVTQVDRDFSLSCDPSATPCQSAFVYSLSNTGEVYFQQTVGSGFNYDWSFGDGSTASTSDPVHVYSGNPSDSFQVCLTIYNSNGCQSTSCQFIYPIPNSNSGCDASFATYDSTANVIYFLPNSPSQDLIYSWDFGDGSALGTSMYPNHYFSNGTYNVCLSVYNMVDSCFDQFCQTIVVNDSVVGPNCQASFTYSYVSNNTIAFQQTSSSPANSYNYSWSFGDGSSASTGDPTHTFAVSGQYDTAYVCLTIFDNAGCQSTTCQYIFVSDSVISGDSCYAYFTYTLSPANDLEVQFTSYSSPNAQYVWSFGDNTSSTQANPTHLYPSASFYTVCLTVYGANGCQNSYCGQVNTGTFQPTYTIYGSVMADSMNVTDATVYLISVDSTNLGLALNLVDAVADSNGYFHFDGLSAGTYLVKAALNSSSPDFANYLPTYYGNSLFWSGASYVFSASSTYLIIDLVGGNNPGGPGFIGGLVSQGANKTEGPGDPINNAQVMVLNMSNQAFAYEMTGADGAFAFPNLPYGTYQVYTEVLGLPTTPVIVTIEPGNTEINNVEVVINSDGVTTGIKKTPTLVEMTDLFPNPAKESVQLNLNSKIEGELSVQIVNMSGMVVNSQVVKANKGQNTIVLPVQSLAAGIYSVKVATENTSIVKRIVKL